MKKQDSKILTQKLIMESPYCNIKGVPPEFILNEFRRAVYFGYYVLIGEKPEQILKQFEDWISQDEKENIHGINIREAIIRKFEDKIDFNTKPLKHIQGISKKVKQNKNKDSKTLNLYEQL